MKQQTAVEWLATRLLYPDIHNPYIEKALEMEKKQIIDANWEGCEDSDRAEQYYNQTFKSE
jgi:hypothetical protein